jgi:hypothetical protein
MKVEAANRRETYHVHIPFRKKILHKKYGGGRGPHWAVGNSNCSLSGTSR